MNPLTCDKTAARPRARVRVSAGAIAGCGLLCFGLAIIAVQRHALAQMVSVQPPDAPMKVTTDTPE